MQADFESLVAESERKPFSGWEFGYLEGRYVEGKPSWDFADVIRGPLRHARSALDLGTGGGEFLSSFAPLPEVCCATEGYSPNARLAEERLSKVGAEVVFTFCDDNDVDPQRGALPFRGERFDLVMDRHESFLAKEVSRVLKVGGTFATQQVGDGNNRELHEFFGRGPESQERKAPWTLAAAVGELESSGLKVEEKREEQMVSKFLDVGAVVYYLKAIPWEVPGFSARRDRKKLYELHELMRETGSFDVTTRRFYLLARKE